MTFFVAVERLDWPARTASSKVTLPKSFPLAEAGQQKHAERRRRAWAAATAPRLPVMSPLLTAAFIAPSLAMSSDFAVGACPICVYAYHDGICLNCLGLADRQDKSPRFSAFAMKP